MHIEALKRFRAEKDDFFRSSPHSPLTAEQKRSFSGLKYFDPNPALDLVVAVEEYPTGEAVDMQTSTGDVQRYERFGRLRFAVVGQEAALTIYRSEHGTFLPFADSLAGTETYGAGRYLEPEELPDGQFVLDFNLAYNPYCAYNEHWSCPLTPAENRLKVPIRAGERVFSDEPHPG